MRLSWQTLLQKLQVQEATPSATSSDPVSDDVTELPTSSSESPPELPVTRYPKRVAKPPDRYM